MKTVFSKEIKGFIPLCVSVCVLVLMSACAKTGTVSETEPADTQGVILSTEEEQQTELAELIHTERVVNQ